MMTNMYVIYDKVAEEAGPVFQAVNDGVALRSAVQTLKPLPVSLREEYTMYCVGTLETKTMSIVPSAPREIDFSFALSRSAEYAVLDVADVNVKEVE